MFRRSTPPLNPFHFKNVDRKTCSAARVLARTTRPPAWQVRDHTTTVAGSGKDFLTRAFSKSTTNCRIRRPASGKQPRLMFPAISGRRSCKGISLRQRDFWAGYFWTRRFLGKAIFRQRDFCQTDFGKRERGSRQCIEARSSASSSVASVSLATQAHAGQALRLCQASDISRSARVARPAERAASRHFAQICEVTKLCSNENQLARRTSLDFLPERGVYENAGRFTSTSAGRLGLTEDTLWLVQKK